MRFTSTALQFTTLGADVIFTCHHGPNECYANKIQSCAIDHIQVDSFQAVDTRESKTLDYVNCLMRAGNNFADSVYPGQKCSRDLQLRNWQRIEQCGNTTEGSNLLQRNGELTLALKPALTSVPTITFRHVSSGATRGACESGWPCQIPCDFSYKYSFDQRFMRLPS